MSKKLLPPGFHDILYPDAAQLQQVCYNLSADFAALGYQEVSPPLLEFEESLSANAALQLSNQMLKTLDPASSKMLALRSDFTAQIARIGTTRLDHSNLPLRISYTGPVIRAQSETIHPLRQLLHTGIEIIGADDENAEFDVLYTVLRALNNLGADDLCLDFSLPTLIKTFIEDYAKDDATKRVLESAIEKKDLATIHAADSTFAALIAPLFEPDISIDTLRSLNRLQDFSGLLDSLHRLVTRITDDFPDLTISIDPLETLKFSYHSGISFALFSRKNNLELGRGGRYRIQHQKKTLEAVGFTFYVDDLLKAVKKKPTEKRVLIASDVAYRSAENLRAEGYITIHHTSSSTNLKEEAQKQGCAYIFENGKLTEI